MLEYPTVFSPISEFESRCKKHDDRQRPNGQKFLYRGKILTHQYDGPSKYTDT